MFTYSFLLHIEKTASMEDYSAIVYSDGIYDADIILPEFYIDDVFLVGFNGIGWKFQSLYARRHALS